MYAFLAPVCFYVSITITIMIVIVIVIKYPCHSRTSPNEHIRSCLKSYGELCSGIIMQSYRLEQRSPLH